MKRASLSTTDHNNIELDSCKLFMMPHEILELICVLLKFNTGLFVTCKTLYALSFTVRCMSGNHLVKLVHKQGRRMPQYCQCALTFTCNTCGHVVMPAFIPTTYILEYDRLDMCHKSKFVCDECPKPICSERTSQFVMDVMGRYWPVSKGALM